MREYKITYKGDYVQGVNFPYYIKKTSLQATNNARKPVALENIAYEGKQYFKKGDSVAIYPENTFYRIEYRDQAGKVFSLYPRAQVNPSMGGLLASPDILHGWGADLYTHVSSVPDPDKEKKWTKKQDFKAKLGDTLFINDMVAVFEKHNLLSKEELGRFFTPQELAEKNCAGLRLSIRVLGKTQAYYVRPLFVAHEKNAAFIPDEIPELGLRLALTNIDTKTEQFSFEVFQGQRDYVVLKATEKPLINVLWVGTLVLMLGFSIAVYRRYQEFARMRNKGLETK
jgi:cytochrome c-type biogenesis protein CcmF